MQRLVSILTWLRNLMLGFIAILQLANIFGYLDLFRGWKYPWTQIIAVLLFGLTYFASAFFLKRYKKGDIKLWHIILSFAFLISFLFLSLNIVLDFGPTKYFLEATMTERRLYVTLGFYSLFAISFALTVALINRLRPGG